MEAARERVVSSTVQQGYRPNSTAPHLGILRLGNVDKCPGSGVHNVQQVDNRGAVVGDGHRAALGKAKGKGWM